MLPKLNPTETGSWVQLGDHFSKMRDVQMRDLFRSDPERFSKFSLSSGEILFDYSKNRITGETLELLLALANECQVPEAISDMFSGARINETENRAVLHTALRNFSGQPVVTDGKDIMPEIKQVLEQMRVFSNKVHSGEWKGYSGKKIRYIVNIGIGGSDLGPYMVTEALKPYWVTGIATFFVSNIDGTHMAETLKKVNPDETLFHFDQHSCHYFPYSLAESMQQSDAYTDRTEGLLQFGR